MTKTLPEASFRSCPSCGAALSRGALTCSYCGGVVAVENLLSRLKAELRYHVNRAGNRLRDRSALIWTLAVFPIFILPPVLALLMIFRALRRPDLSEPGAIHRFDVSVFFIALCNIILSIMFWRWLSEISMSSGLSPGWFFRSIGIGSPRTYLQTI
jgi:hypothetical protein